MAEGADHEPSSSRATTNPVPARPLHSIPALTIVRIAIPAAFFRTDWGINLWSSSLVPLMKWSRIDAALRHDTSIDSGNGLCNFGMLKVGLAKDKELNC